MQFWDAASNSRSSRNETDSTNQELVHFTSEDQLAEDEPQEPEEHRSPLAGEQNSVKIEGSAEHNQPGLPGSAYVLDANFADTSGGGVPDSQDASALAKGLQQADQTRASGFFSTHSGLLTYQGAEQGGISSSLSRRLEVAVESNSQAAAAAAGYSVNRCFSGTTFPSSQRLNPYFLQRHNQQAYGATAIAEPKAASAFGEAAAYGSTAGALSLQQQFLTAVEVGSSSEMPDLVDPSSWRIQGAQPESVSPSSTSSGERSERRKRKSEAEETSGKPYACRFCSQSFDKSQALGGHMNRHRQEREREQLDNAQKLVLKQQGLQGLSGLPLQSLQNLNARVKAHVQGPSPLLSLDQVTLSRYNQAVQYQHPRAFLTGTGIQANPYSSLQSSALLNNPGTWNTLGSYVGGGTASIASGSSMSQLETSGSSNLARVVSGATPEDLFAASVLQSSAATGSPQLGRSGETTDNQAEPEMMYGYPGVSTLTEDTTSGSETRTSPCHRQFNFSNVSQTFEPVPHRAQSHVQLYGGTVQNQGSQLPQIGEED